MHSFVQQQNKIKYPEVVMSISKLKPIIHLCSFPLIFFWSLLLVWSRPFCCVIGSDSTGCDLLINLTFRLVASSSGSSYGLAVHGQHWLTPFRAKGSLGRHPAAICLRPACKKEGKRQGWPAGSWTVISCYSCVQTHVGSYCRGWCCIAELDLLFSLLGEGERFR